MHTLRTSIVSIATFGLATASSSLAHPADEVAPTTSPPAAVLAESHVGDVQPPSTSAESDRDVAIHETRKAHAVAARADFGRGYSYGLGYSHLWEDAQSSRGAGVVGWGQVGGDVRLFGLASIDHIVGAGLFGTGRVSGAGDVMGGASS
jgi:hypothetical protein